MMAGEKKSPVTFTKNDVEIIARDTRYDGFFPLSATVSAIAALMAR